MKNEQRAADSREEIISYQKLRTFIGLTGMLLPLLVWLGSYAFGAGEYAIQPSISHYYYSKMHVVFVCTLGILGGFLLTYKGKKREGDFITESNVANIAGWCALGVAAFPTRYCGFRTGPASNSQYLSLVDNVSALWGNIHFALAGILFVCFAAFCLYYFQRPDNTPQTESDEKKFKRRKKIYKVCGWGILISIALIALFSFVFDYAYGIFAYATFIFEWTALWFFGFAWLVKGSETWKRVPVLKKMISPLR